MRENLTAARVITASLKAAGLDLPAALDAALDGLAPIASPRLADEGLVDAYARAALAGRDPSADKAVTAALARQQLARALNWEPALTDWQDARTGDLLREHADAIIDAICTRATEAGDTIAAATKVLAPVALADQSAQALRGGEKMSTAWRGAVESVAVVDRLAQAMSALAGLLGGHQRALPGANIVLRAPDIPADVLASVRADVSTWDLAAQHGQHIDVASPSRWTESLARITAERQAAQADTERQRKSQLGMRVR